MKSELIRELRAIVGKDAVTDDAVETSTYSYDASGECLAPEAVVWATSENEVSEILKVAHREGIPVVPRGMGSGRSGGSVPVGGGIVLSLERMNRILEIDPPNRQALVEPGVRTAGFKEAVLAQGLYYPPDPASSAYCTLGGNAATSAGGLSCLKYGTTKDYVQQLRVVLADGTILSLGSKAQKSVTGYEMVHFFVGSEGCLGVITQIRLKLLPAPVGRATLLAEFDSTERAAQAVMRMLVLPVIPSSLEFADQATLDCAREYGAGEISENCRSMLLVQVDTPSAGTDIELFADVCKASGATAVRHSENREEQEALWDIRRSFSPATYRAAKRKIAEDVSVPAASIPELLERVYAIGEKHNRRILCFGHAGDGNVHVNYLTDLDDDPELTPALEEIFRAVIDLGGTLSGEHGVGLTKAPYLRMEIGDREMEYMRKIKQLFDPKGILNPGKIFPAPPSNLCADSAAKQE